LSLNNSNFKVKSKFHLGMFFLSYNIKHKINYFKWTEKNLAIEESITPYNILYKYLFIFVK